MGVRKEKSPLWTSNPQNRQSLISVKSQIK